MTQVSGDGHLIGVDVGGTKVAAGLVNAAGEITFQTRTPMVSNDAAAGLAAVLSAIDSVRAGTCSRSHPVSGIGICAPGPLDPRTGIVINPPNLPGWRNFPLAAEISMAYSLPVVLTTTVMPPHLRKLCGALDAGIEMYSVPPSAQELERALCLIDRFITAALALPRKAVILPSITADHAVDVESWAASKF
jgi:hypothetical protein